MSKWKDRDYLVHEYHDKGRSMSDIADENGVSYNKVRSRMVELNIERRGTNETRYFDKRQKLANRKDEIIEKYVSDNIPLYKLAEEYDVNDATMKRYLNEWGVDTRNISEQHRATSDYPKLGDKEWLQTQYRDKQRYCPEIAKELGCTTGNVAHALHQHNIETWDHGQTISGEQCIWWKGGPEERDSYYGDNWDEVREERIELDDFKCAACGMGRENHKDKWSCDLSVHHITPIADYDNVEAANELSNLVTLCRRCHRKWEGIPLRPQ